MSGGEKETSALGRVAQSLGILTLLVLLVGLGWFLGFYYSCYGYELEEWQDFSVGYHPETGRAFVPPATDSTRSTAGTCFPTG